MVKSTGSVIKMLHSKKKKMLHSDPESTTYKVCIDLGQVDSPP